MKSLFLLFYNFTEDYLYLKNQKFLDNNIFLSKPIIFDVGSHQGKMTNLFKSVYNDAKYFLNQTNLSIRV